MPHRCLTYVVLASILSSQVRAAPTGQPFAMRRYAPMCDDPTLSWDEKVEASCPICVMDSFPKELWDKYCGPTMAPASAHELAQVVWRRDAALTDGLKPHIGTVSQIPTVTVENGNQVQGKEAPDNTDDNELPGEKPNVHEVENRIYKPEVILPRSQEPEIAAMLVSRQDSEDDIELHTLPYPFEPEAIIPARPDTKPSPIISPSPIGGPGPAIPHVPIISPRPVSVLPPVTATNGEMHITSKRDSVESDDSAQESLPLQAITTGLWVETHHKADGIYRREQTEPQVSTLPAEATTVDETKITHPGHPVNAAVGEGLGKSADGVMMTYDNVIHKPAPIVWRRETPGRRTVNLPSSATTHELSSAVVGKPPVKEQEKREAIPVPPPEFFEHTHLPVNPVPSDEASTVAPTPSYEQSTYQAPPVSHPVSKRNKDDDDPYKNVKPPQVWFTPALVHQQTTDIHRRQASTPETNPAAVASTPEPSPETIPTAPATPDPNSIQSLADRLKSEYPYATAHFTPSITHATANDIHRRADVQARDESDKERRIKWGEPVWTPVLTHGKAGGVYRRGEAWGWVA